MAPGRAQLRIRRPSPTGLWTTRSTVLQESASFLGVADFNPHRPFTYQEALRSGMPRRRLQGSDYREVVRGIHVAVSSPELGTRARSGLLVAKEPDAFLSHHEAAGLWGGVVPHSPLIHVSVPTGRPRRRRDGVRVHASRRRPVTFRGLPVTSPTDTFLDLAGQLDLVDLVVLGDSLVKRSRTTPEQLIRAAEAATGRHVRLARRAASLVRSGVDSPMETRLRLLMVLAGLPEPEVNVVLRRSDGSVARRLDLGYRSLRLGIEYDGRQHHKSREVYENDILRREELEDDDWRIVTLVSKDIFVSPARTLERLVRVLHARGHRVTRLRQEWRRYFPDREQPG